MTEEIHLVMEYFPEITLSKLLQKRKYIPENEAKIIVYNLCEAVDYMHS